MPLRHVYRRLEAAARKERKPPAAGDAAQLHHGSVGSRHQRRAAGVLFFTLIVIFCFAVNRLILMPALSRDGPIDSAILPTILTRLGGRQREPLLAQEQPWKEQRVPDLAGLPTTKAEQGNQTLLSPLDMFVELSDMLPDHRGSCPDLPGYPAQQWDDRTMDRITVKPCYNLLKRASDQNNCIIYNFGVDKTDPLIRYMSHPQTTLPNCDVYAFDPFVSPSQLRMKLGPRVHFYEVGLWNGHSPRTGLGTEGTGRLLSLAEIQRLLNHTDQHQITYFRSDCEGCEYGWIEQAMKDDPAFFRRVDQMFIEIHTIEIRYMQAINLRWNLGLPPTSLLKPVHQILTQDFRVVHAAVNPGGPPDRNRVSSTLQTAGVLQHPCCREFDLVNARLAAPLRPTDNTLVQCERFRRIIPSLETTKEFLDAKLLSAEFVNLFRGHLKTCPGGEKCVGSDKSDETCYCASILDSDQSSSLCVVYFFANLALPKDRFLLQAISKSHPRCAIHVFDPRWNAKENQHIFAVGKLPNVVFKAWGLFGGSGKRVLKTPSRSLGDGVHAAAGIGELYTMEETALGYSQQLTRFLDLTVPNPPPTRISLLRVDWTMASSCVWQKEILTHFEAWFGSYKGSTTVQQLV